MFLDLLHSDVCCTPRGGGVPTGPHVCREHTFVLMPITAPSPSHLYFLCKLNEFVTMLVEFSVFLDLLHLMCAVHLVIVVFLLDLMFAGSLLLC